MKPLINRGLFLFMILALFLGISFYTTKTAAKQTNAEIPSNNEIPSEPAPEPAKTPDPIKPAVKKPSLATDLKSDHAPDQAKLTAYLDGIGSPLAPYAQNLASSEFWALLIGICHIEQYGCTKAPYNNYWGMMKSGGGLRHFTDLPEAIAYMDSYFVKLYPRKQTVQSLRGYYCASACTNWEPTVLRVKALLESSM